MHIDFYFDFISPYSYLAACRIPELERNGIRFEWLPLNLPRLIKLSGNIPPGQIRNKALYSLRDLRRWAAWLEVPFRMIKPGSFDSRPALRIAGALEGPQRALFSQAVFRSIWSGDIDPRRENWLERVFAAHDLPAEWIKLGNEAFEENTHRALKAGAFGVPSFVVHAAKRPELYFGLDHMDMMLREIRR